MVDVVNPGATVRLTSLTAAAVTSSHEDCPATVVSIHTPPLVAGVEPIAA